ncbi:MAG TPA: CsgG/HfaB family protein [Thermoanaerobaculia bacterium]|nr:CsgG/HfaB family protein [Thermoanaerobaculia bacterium]
MFLKTSPLLAILLLLANASPSGAQVEKGLYKLGLISGEKEKKHESEKERRYRQDVLNAATDAFVATRRFTMVERNQLDAIFTEKSLQDFIGGQVNNKLTDVLGLDLVGVVGYTVETSKSSEGKPVTKCIIDVRLVDVKTASILATVTSDRPDLALLLPSSTPREAEKLLYKSIRDAFPPLGYVVSVSGKDIIIDLGTEAGLKNGDTLEIVQEGEQIIHPVTGKVLSAPMKVIGELKVVTTAPQVSTCKLKSKGMPPIASLVRLKGSRSLILDWGSRIPFIKNNVENKKKEVEK